MQWDKRIQISVGSCTGAVISKHYGSTKTIGAWYWITRCTDTLSPRALGTLSKRFKWQSLHRRTLWKSWHLPTGCDAQAADLVPEKCEINRRKKAKSQTRFTMSRCKARVYGEHLFTVSLRMGIRMQEYYASNRCRLEIFTKTIVVNETPFSSSSSNCANVRRINWSYLIYSFQ